MRVKKENGVYFILQYKPKSDFRIKLQINYRMNDQDKTKAELIKELQDMRQKIESNNALLHKEISERNYKRLFNSTGTANSIFDTNCNLILQNKLSQKILGRGEKGAINRSVFEVFGEEQGKHIFDRMKRVINTGVSEMFETEFNLPSGTNWFRSAYQPVFDENKNVISVQVISRNITEIKKAEKELLKAKEEAEINEKKFRNLVWDMSVGVLLQGPQAQMWLSNPAALELLGLTEDQLMGKTSFDPYWNVIHEDGSPYPGPTHPVPKAIEEGRPVRNVVMGVYRPEKKDRVWLLVDAIPETDEKGKVLQVVCTFINITALKQAELLLKNKNEEIETQNVELLLINDELRLAKEKTEESEEKFRRLFEDDLTGDFVTNENGILLDCNPAFLEIFGYSDKKEIIMEHITVLYPDLSEYDLIVSDLRKNRILKNYETIRKRKNGDLINVDENLVASFNTEDEIYEIKGYLYDVTKRTIAEHELRESEIKLKELNAEKDKFFSIITHDLRSPFSGFLGLTQIMAEELSSLSMAQLQELAISLKNSATNLYSLLENLLKWSMVQLGSIPFTPGILKLSPMVEECVTTVIEPAKIKGIEITCTIPENTEVCADSNMLQTVIRNLVSNALKFTPKGGKISVSSKTDNKNGIEISIHDTGIGMSKTIVSNLFRSDVQTNRKGTEGEPSSGLGLILCKEFVEKHGGKIWVESEVGNGSTFYFTLPFENPLIEKRQDRI